MLEWITRWRMRRMLDRRPADGGDALRRWLEDRGYAITPFRRESGAAVDAEDPTRRANAHKARL